MKRKALYETISDDLEHRILTDELKPGDILPSENKLAEQYGVSRITARQALVELQNKGYVIRKTGIGSIVIERTVEPEKKAGVGIVALILPFDKTRGRIMDTFFGINNAIRDQNAYLTIHVTNYDSARERTIINRLVSDGVNGIILYPWTRNRNIDLYNKLLIREFPMVFIDRFYDSLPVSSVTSDNAGGGYQATKYLLELGHRNIAFATDRDPDEVSTVRERYFGFCRARSEAGLLNLNQNDLLLLDMNTERTLDALHDNPSPDDPLLKPVQSAIRRLMKDNCTGLVCLNDYVAIAFVRTAERMGIRVPEDLSVCGFDDIAESNYLARPLTTVRQDFFGIGEKAGNLILEHIRTGKPDNRSIVQPVELIKRCSAAQIRVS